jgi:hypothetical protein
MARNFGIGTVQMLRGSDSSTLPATRTMACWIQPITAALTGSAFLLNEHAIGLINGYLMSLSNGHPKAQSWSSANPVALGTSTYTAGVWGHIAATFNSLGLVTVYFNGVVDATSSLTDMGTPVSADTWTLGNHPTTSTGLAMQGLVAEAAVWNIMLSGADIVALAAGISPLLIQPGLLRAYWPLIGNTSPEADLRGRAELTVTGATVASHPRIFIPTAMWRSKSAPVVLTNTGRMFGVF